MTNLFNELNEIIGEGLFKNADKNVDIKYVRRALAHQIYEHQESMTHAHTGPSMHTWHEGCVHGLKLALQILGENDED